MPSKNPLEDRDLDHFLDAAPTSPFDSEREQRRALVAHLLPLTGLRASAAAHMTSDWVRWQRDDIRVPARRECNCSECQDRLAKLRDQYQTIDADLASLEGESWETITDQGVSYLADLNDRLGRRVVRELVEGDGAGLWVPKTESGARTIPIRNPDLRRHLEDWFRSRRDLGVTRQTIHADVVDLAEAAGLTRKVFPHHLRHTFGTRLAANGANASFIKSVMGHEDLSTSQQYIELSDQRIHDQADEVML